ncbi:MULTISPECIES: hypothetical protein [unclassified Rhizobium]|uniref:hypothetical protein n=1 Tax=unclassified Rhizobium TaxID=2613769 RepID=UPI001AE758E1|nr:MULTISPECIES: hypothetical protein [unclassified Rhizobium]MBP2461471.1 hypothetical protein [Rhizobium sp. PvP014]MBP2528867.1 hypothetical protein [Rhizobium sp. PvP099]
MIAVINGVMRKINNLRLIGSVIIAVSLGALFLIDDVSSSRRSDVLVSVLGPVGALWFFRLLCLLFIGIALWVIYQDVKLQTRVDRIIAQQISIDKSVRRDK